MKQHTNFKRLNVPEIRIYLMFLCLFSIVMFFLERWIGIVAGIISISFFIYNFIHAKKRKEAWSEYLEDLSEEIDWATRYTVLNIPMALAIVEEDGEVVWYNPRFSQLFGQKLIEKNIDECIPTIHFKKLMDTENSDKIIVSANNQNFLIETKKVSLHNNIPEEKNIILLYFKNITEQMRLEDLYDRTQLVVICIQIDNYDEVMHQTQQDDRPLIAATVDRIISDWVSAVNGCMQKYDEDKYYIVMEVQSLNIIEESKFKLLDEVREIEQGNSMPVTLSIGVGFEGETPKATEQYARDAIDLALGRGGDQAVVKNRERLLFYGGKTKAVEKRAKVKSRVIANALRKLIQESRDIYIMGHRSPDLDAIGAALGVYRCAAHSQKSAYIVVNEQYDIIKDIEKRAKEEIYRDIFITPDAANARIADDSLVVVVDTHRPSFVEAPMLLKGNVKTVVIDHHRRGADQIEDAVLSYLEPYASSTCELVTEIVQYYDDKVTFKTIEAETLLAGIIMDTKSFTHKTGVRTFEAASYLRRGGADPVKVKEFFEEDLSAYRERTETVASAKYIAKGTVISICHAHSANAAIVAAQAADALINIKDIQASFVLCKIEELIMVSARSDGSVNVQVILEKIGGGGHMTIAGAQLEIENMNDAIEMVTKAYKEYEKDEESES